VNSEDRTRITVDIFGTPYKLMGNSSTGYMRMVASHVHEHMNKIAKGHPRLDTTRIAVLAAVNMADDFFRQKEDWEKSVKNSNNEQMAVELRKLKEEREKMQDAHAVNLQRLEEYKQREIAMAEEQQKLQDELEHVKKQYETELKQIQEEDGKAREIAEAHRKLQEDYAKLQNEFNEWIQLAGHDEPGAK
jgi:cell division protein ZapA (FtsZ GTPase activity inhibitor)